MKWNKSIWLGATLLLIVILVISCWAGGWEAIPSGIVAWGTILLAVATFLLIRHSNKQAEKDRAENERLRKEDRAENERLREEERKHMSNKFAIDKIYDFAKKLIDFTFSQQVPMNATELLKQQREILAFTFWSFEVSQYVEVFFKSLKTPLQQAVDDLLKYSNCMKDVENDRITKQPITWSGEKRAWEEILASEPNMMSLIDEKKAIAWASANNLLHVTVALKMKLKV